jgi:hypothetical protein
MFSDALSPLGLGFYSEMYPNLPGARELDIQVEKLANNSRPRLMLINHEDVNPEEMRDETGAKKSIDDISYDEIDSYKKKYGELYSVFDFKEIAQEEVRAYTHGLEEFDTPFERPIDSDVSFCLYAHIKNHSGDLSDALQRFRILPSEEVKSGLTIEAENAEIYMFNETDIKSANRNVVVYRRTINDRNIYFIAMQVVRDSIPTFHATLIQEYEDLAVVYSKKVVGKMQLLANAKVYGAVMKLDRGDIPSNSKLYRKFFNQLFE